VTETGSGAGDGRIISLTATCPKDQLATGGGFAALEAPENTPFIVIFESRKINQNAWRVQGQITDPRRTGELRSLFAQAYCSKDAPKTKVDVLDSTSQGGLTLTPAEPSCLPRKGRARAAGFSGVPPVHVDPPGAIDHQVGSSLLLGPSLLVSPFYAAHSTILASTAGIPFTSYVYCARKSAGKLFAAVGLTENATNKANVNVSTAPCKNHRKVVSGGFNQPNYSFSPPYGWYSEVWISIRNGKQWLVSAIHHGTASTQLQPIAYCAPSTS
jgi:hypothetical protein